MSDMVDALLGIPANADMSYTVGVQIARFWPFHRKYKVVNHIIEDTGGHLRAALQFANGGMLVIPGLDRKKFIIYPDYRRVYHLRQERQRQEATAKVADDLE